MFDIHQSVFEKYSGELDEDRAEDYIDELMEAFGQSPEGQAVAEEDSRAGWAAMLMDYGFRYLGLSVAEMSASDVREVVFEIFPSKVSTDAESAGEVVAELKAFWSFLLRAYSLPNAAKILEIFSGDAEERLRQELSDSSNFGPAKSFFMMGQQAGFDMTTQEGCDEFVRAYNASLLGSQRGEEALSSGGPRRKTRVKPLQPRLSPKERAKVRKAKLAEIKARRRK
jgi:hypothetical protein